MPVTACIGSRSFVLSNPVTPALHQTSFQCQLSTENSQHMAANFPQAFYYRLLANSPAQCIFPGCTPYPAIQPSIQQGMGRRTQPGSLCIQAPLTQPAIKPGSANTTLLAPSSEGLELTNIKVPFLTCSQEPGGSRRYTVST